MVEGKSNQGMVTAHDMNVYLATDVRVQARYDIAESMEGLHEGANIILCMWTYYRRGLSPVDVDWDKIRKSPPKAKKQLQYISDDVQRLMTVLCTASEGDSKPKNPYFSQYVGHILTEPQS